MIKEIKEVAKKMKKVSTKTELAILRLELISIINKYKGGYLYEKK